MKENKSKIALQTLLDGNKRFVQGRSVASESMQEKREKTVDGQSPFAIVLACADSRVAPEVIFDQSIGDIFTVRVAGNIADETQTESINYAAGALGSPLLMVLGHESCGAVNAVVSGNSAALPRIAEFIEPAVEKFKNESLESAVKANVMATVNQLGENPLLAELVKKGQLKMVGGYYSLHTGEVTLI